MMQPLRELPALAKINISKTMVTDIGFAALAQIPTLSHVDAEGLGLTDGIGAALRGMARLEHLNLLFTLEISDDIVRQLNFDVILGSISPYLSASCHPARTVRCPPPWYACVSGADWLLAIRWYARFPSSGPVPADRPVAQPETAIP